MSIAHSIIAHELQLVSVPRLPVRRPGERCKTMAGNVDRTTAIVTFGDSKRCCVTDLGISTRPVWQLAECAPAVPAPDGLSSSIGGR